MLLYCGATEKLDVWMSSSAMPAFFKVAKMRVMAALFLANASFAVTASLSTPVEMMASPPELVDKFKRAVSGQN